jgi:hypothetical protein
MACMPRLVKIYLSKVKDRREESVRAWKGEELSTRLFANVPRVNESVQHFGRRLHNLLLFFRQRVFHGHFHV